MSHNRKLRGFTLLELLVVVAIIALLISILLPSLSAAREQARSVKCAANLKTYGTANQMYANEEDGYYVPVRTEDGAWTEPGPGYPYKWYVNPKFFSLLGVDTSNGMYDGYGEHLDPGLLCPSAPNDIFGEFRQDWRTYGINYTDVRDASGNPSFGSQFQGYKVVNINSPSQKINFMCATNWAMTYNRAQYRTQWDVYGQGTYPDAWVAYRHREGANFLLHDGHAEHKSKQAAYDISNDEIHTQWNLGD